MRASRTNIRTDGREGARILIAISAGSGLQSTRQRLSKRTIFKLNSQHATTAACSRGSLPMSLRLFPACPAGGDLSITSRDLKTKDPVPRLHSLLGAKRHCRAASSTNWLKYGEKLRSNVASVTFPAGSTPTLTTTAGLPSIVFRALSGILGSTRRVIPSCASLSRVASPSDRTGGIGLGADGGPCAPGAAESADNRCDSPAVGIGPAVRRIAIMPIEAPPTMTKAAAAT